LSRVTYHDLAVAARATFEAAGITAATARLDADLLARHVLGWDQAAWLARRHDAAAAAFAPAYAALVARREAREPVAYLRGVQEFWGRDFVVNAAVLIPRSETELLVEAANEFLAARPHAVVADVGTGSGCLAVTLALEHPAIVVHASDISAEALDVARLNAARLGAGDRIRFHQTAYLDGVVGPIDLIVANPPYIDTPERKALAPEVGVHEPSVALFGGDDGLRDVRAVLQAARRTLSPNGLVACEFGSGQADAVAFDVESIAGLELRDIRPDLYGIPRIVIARRADR
jgi:release factor glutamine methyltransferase